MQSRPSLHKSFHDPEPTSDTLPTKLEDLPECQEKDLKWPVAQIVKQF